MRLSHAAKALYIDLSMRADDDGFVDDSYTSTELTHTGEAELSELTERHFIICFDSGVIAIRHWNINNTLQKDRYHPTRHVLEKKMTTISQNNEIILLEPGCIQNVSKPDTEISLVKPSPVKSSIDKQEENSRAQEGEPREETNAIDWKSILDAAKEKGIQLTTKAVTILNSEKGRMPLSELYGRIFNDAEYLGKLRDRCNG